MADERLTLVVEADYAAALGMALFAFATLESEAIWCCEQIEIGSIRDLDDRTAGNVAERLANLLRTLAPSPDRERLSAAAARFQALVKTRNLLFHSKPVGLGQTNVLSRRGDPWTLSEINDAADSFAKCAEVLNSLLNSYLTPLKDA